MQTIGLYLRHTPVGKTTQKEPYTAAAHARYIMRKNAMERVFSGGYTAGRDGELIPFPVHWHGVQRLLGKREDTIRKNGRVCDKFIIALPRDLGPDNAEALLRNFGDRIGQGKAPYLATFHWNDENPHAHMIFIDADPVTGKRVFGTSDHNSTATLKQAWADECNGLLMKLGIETRVEYRQIADEVIEPELAATPVDLPLPSDIEVPEAPTVSEDLPTEPEPAPEPEPEPVSDDDEALSPEEIEAMAPKGVDAVKEALDCDRRLEEMARYLRDRDRLKAEVVRASAAAQQAAAKAEAYRQEAVVAEGRQRDAEAVYRQEGVGMFGTMRGFHVKALGREWKSAGRQQAEKLQSEVKQWERASTEAVYKRDAWYAQAQLAEQQAQTTQAELEQAEARMKQSFRILGSDKTISFAQSFFDKERTTLLYNTKADDIVAAHKAGDLSDAQAERALHLIGRADVIPQLKASQKVDNDNGWRLH